MRWQQPPNHAMATVSEPGHDDSLYATPWQQHSHVMATTSEPRHGDNLHAMRCQKPSCHAACDRRVAEQAARKEAIRNGDTESRRPSSCRRSRAATRRDAPRPTWRCLKPRRRARRSSKRRRARWRAAQRAAPTCPARGAGGAPLGQLRLVRPRRARKTRADHACTFQGRVWGVCACLPYARLYTALTSSGLRFTALKRTALPLRLRLLYVP